MKSKKVLADAILVPGGLVQNRRTLSPLTMMSPRPGSHGKAGQSPGDG